MFLDLFNKDLSKQDIETLKSLDFFVSQWHKYKTSFAVPNKENEAIKADLMRWLIQRHLDERKAGELIYTWGEMYLAVGIPKEMLQT